MRPKILIFVARYLPGYKSGGPIRTIANMVDHLGDEFDFHIVTADRDAGDIAPYPNIQIDSWNTVGKAQVFYCSLKNYSLGALGVLLNDTPHDILYLNSFFADVFTIRPLILRRFGRLPNRPLLLAPRGEFSEGALQLKSLKKATYLRLARLLNLYGSLTWQASSEHEVADIRRAMGSVAHNCVVAPNVPPVVLVERECPSSSPVRNGPLQIIFLSRISPKKNLDYALRVLTTVRVPVVFNIYGPSREDAYWHRCKALIDALPDHVNAIYHGPVDHRLVPKVMAANDLFFLPTRGENYGHVIPEALSAGTPVLISDTTPWRNLAEAGVGWDLPLTSGAAFRDRIEACAAMGVDDHTSLRQRARAYIQKQLTDPAIIEANRQMFISLIK